MFGIRSRVLIGATAAVTVVHAVALGAELARTSSTPKLSPFFSLGFFIATTAFAVVGTAILLRFPRHATGVVFFTIGCAFGLEAATEQLAVRGDQALATHLAPLALALFGVGFALLLTFMLLLFPDGRLPSPRWRWVAALSAAVFSVSVLASTLKPVAQLPLANVALPNAWGLDSFSSAVEAIVQVTDLAGVPLILACCLSPFFRFRRADKQQRAQLKWFALAGVFVLLAVVASPLYAQFDALSVLFLLAVVAVPAAAGVAILQYRLYDIDLVLHRTLVYLLTAATIVGIYAVIVGGLGSAFQPDQDPLLSIGATVVAALAFNPVRDRAQRLARRAIYGHRATPYEALNALARRMAHTVSGSDLLPAIAEHLAAAVGAEYVCIVLYLSGGRTEAVSWPAEAEGAETQSIVVEHQGEVVGQLHVAKPANAPLAAVEQRLLDDLAAQAGLAFANLRYAEELRVRLEELAYHAEELRSSRRRIVDAGDQARRRLERDLHDGVQQRLVRLRMHVSGLATAIEGGSQDMAKSLIAEVDADADAASSELRRFARGILPAVLTEEGLTAALESLADRAPIPVGVNASEEMGRFGQVQEIAAYFIASEALTNALKHGQATQVSIQVEVRADDGGPSLVVATTDDGIGGAEIGATSGGLRGSADRAAALGGTLTVGEGVDGGTTVTAVLPIDASPDETSEASSLPD